MSIKFKLALIFLAIALIPLLIVSALTFTNFKNSLEANHIAQLKDIGILRAERIEQHIAGLKTRMAISQGFYNIKKNLPVCTRFAGHPDKPQFVAAQQMLSAQLRQMQSVSDMSDIMLIGPDGIVVYANRSGHYLKNMSQGMGVERQTFAQGTKSLYVSDVYFDSAEDKRFEMLVAAPAAGFNGAFIGVIAFEVDMTRLYALIQDETGLGRTGEIVVARKTGDQVEFLNPLRHDPHAALTRKTTIGDAAGFPIQQAVQGRTGAGLTIDYRGKRVIAAWRYIPSLGWGLVAKIDTREAFADERNLKNLVLIILVIIIVFSGIVAFTLAQSISRPINILTKGAGIIGSGNLEHRVGTAHKDEIGQLSRAFDRMTRDLKTTIASRDELNREIAERKMAEEALRESEERFKAIAETTPVNISVVGIPDEKLLYVNPTFEKTLGYEKSGLIGKGTPDFYWNTEDRERVLDVLKERGAVADYELKLKCRDGTPFWGLFSVRSITYGGRPAYLGAFIDISARKKAEEALIQLSLELEKKVEKRTEEIKQSNELLRLEVAERAKAENALLQRQQVLEAIYAIETTFTVSLEDVFDQVAITVSNLVNLPYAAVGRVEKGRLITLTQLINNNFSHEKSVPLFAHFCGIALRERMVCQYAGKLKVMFPEEMKSFDYDVKSYIGVPIADKDGTLIGVICAMGPVEHACNDLEVHSMEIFARYLGREIEREIMDEQLRVAGEINLLGRIASGVAHEVRNPLNGILAISEALFLEIGDNPEYLPYLEHIKTQVNRLSLLMKDLLDLGKPIARSEFIPQPLEQIIRSVIDSLKHSSSNKNRTVHFTPSPAGAPLVVKADGVKLQQVFLNLIENACDHSPAGEPVIIEMNVTAETGEEPNTVVRVIDRGRGIAPDLLEKVFEPFFTTRKGGTGLGLSIVRHIVQLHGGSVFVANNTPGPGVTAEVRLPLYKIPEAV